MCVRKNLMSAGILALSLAVVRPVIGQTGWTKYVNNPVMTKDTTLAGIWEWAGIGQPSCIFEDDTIKMYYAAGGVAYIGDSVVRGRISYAYSTNAVNWIKRSPPVPVLDVGPAHAWDSRWLDTPAIVRDQSGYKLYYYGDSLSVVYSAIGMASSTDGIVWTKSAANPVLEKGELMEWDGFWIESPAVLFDSVSGFYEMWYTGVGYGPGYPSGLKISIGRAISVDGEAWVKDTLHNPVLDVGVSGSFDDGWVSVPGVRKTGGQYEMWYIGASIADYEADSMLDTARVGYATSMDGVNWTKYAGNPVLSTFDPPVDTGGPWAPDVVFDGSMYRMLYEAVGGIFLASAAMGTVQERSGEGLPMIAVFPNPFHRNLEIKFQIPNLKYQTSSKFQTALKIYDTSGRLVKQFNSLTIEPFNQVFWDGTDDAGRKVPSGVYFIRVRAPGFERSASCILLGT